jgi:hypothetical protein
MTLTARQRTGIAILSAIVLGLIVWAIYLRDDPDRPNPGPHDPITVVGYSGALKVSFLKDPEVAAILRDRYGITVDVEGTPTSRMLCEVSIEEVDFLWVGDQSQIDTYEVCRQRSDPARNIFFSPVVIYSWADTADALIDQGVVSIADDGSYRVDMVELLALIDSGKTWIDIGLENRPSRIIVKTTDPTASTSGRHFSALLANAMSCMEVVGNSTVESILPSIHSYFELLGFMPTQSAELFRLYLSIGEGQYPLVALYESQIVEFVISNPDDVEAAAASIRMLYPEPTVWITHPVIALTDNGQRFMQALLDPELQRMAWEKNGFRPFGSGVDIDLGILPIAGVQEQITSVIDVPSNPVMDRILEALVPEYVPDPNAPPRRTCEDGTTSGGSPVPSP